jgi:hypothetical protein
MLLRVLIATIIFVECAAQKISAQDTDTLQKAKAEAGVVFYTSAGLRKWPLVTVFKKFRSQVDSIVNLGETAKQDPY